MIEWTKQAARQLEQAHEFLAVSNSEDIADEVTFRILVGVEQLSNFPLSGRVGRVAGTRELVISNTPFLAAYAVEKTRIVILAIYHGARRWPEEL